MADWIKELASHASTAVADMSESYKAWCHQVAKVARSTAKDRDDRGRALVSATLANRDLHQVHRLCRQYGIEAPPGQAEAVPAPEPPPPAGETLVAIPLDQIRRGNNPRKTFDEARLQELADSIRADGQQVPALVRRTAEGYELVAGERRWRACGLAEVPTLLCRIVEADACRALKLALVENAVRVDVHPLEEADALHQYVEVGGDLDELRRELNRSEAWVRDRLALARLSPGLRTRFRAGAMGLRAAATLAFLAEEQQEGLAKSAWCWPMGPAKALDIVRSGKLLSRAPFPLAACHLGGRGSCDGCTHRTDVQVDLLQPTPAAGVACTDDKCFAEKRLNWLAEQEAAGQRVVRDRYPGEGHHEVEREVTWRLAEALRAASTPAPVEEEEEYDELEDDDLVDDEGNLNEEALAERRQAQAGKPTPTKAPTPTWAQLVPEAPTTLWLTPGGELQRTIADDDAIEALRKKGRDDLADVLKASIYRSGQRNPAQRRPRAKPKLVLLALDQLFAAIEAAPTKLDLTSIVKMLARSAGYGETGAMLKRRGVKLETGSSWDWAKRLIDEATTPEQQTALLLELLLAPHLGYLLSERRVSRDSPIVEWMERMGVDIPADMVSAE